MAPFIWRRVMFKKRLILIALIFFNISSVTFLTKETVNYSSDELFPSKLIYIFFGGSGPHPCP